MSISQLDWSPKLVFPMLARLHRFPRCAPPHLVCEVLGSTSGLHAYEVSALATELISSFFFLTLIAFM